MSGNQEKFIDFIMHKVARGEQLYKSILAKIAHCIDGIADAIRESANLANDECLDWTAYPKSDKWSIIFAILNLLDDGEWRMPERLTTEDIPAILEFLDTPPGKELEAWDKWEKYWDNLDYPARRKRLLSGEAHGEEKE